MFFCRKERRRQRNREKKRRNQRLTTESCKFPQTHFFSQRESFWNTLNTIWYICNILNTLRNIVTFSAFFDAFVTLSTFSDDDLYAVPQFSGQPRVVPCLRIFLPVLIFMQALHSAEHIWASNIGLFSSPWSIWGARDQEKKPIRPLFTLDHTSSKTVNPVQPVLAPLFVNSETFLIKV